MSSSAVIPTLLMVPNYLAASATFDANSLLTLTGQTTTISVPGAVMGDFVRASHSVNLAGVTVTAWVSADGTVSVRFQNDTAGTVDLASGTLRVIVTPKSAYGL